MFRSFSVSTIKFLHPLPCSALALSAEVHQFVLDVGKPKHDVNCLHLVVPMVSPVHNHFKVESLLEGEARKYLSPGALKLFRVHRVTQLSLTLALFLSLRIAEHLLLPFEDRIDARLTFFYAMTFEVFC
jgi:hypothetical protein